MGFLLRQGKRSTWSGAPPDDQRRQDALVTFRRREIDTDGLSLYEIENDDERDAVVAAFACARADDDPIDLLEISREDIEKYGPITQSDGDLPLSTANTLHRSLDWDAATLERLASDLFEAGKQARRFSRPEVRAAVMKVAVDDVEGEEAKAFVAAQHQRKTKV